MTRDQRTFLVVVGAIVLALGVLDVTAHVLTGDPKSAPTAAPTATVSVPGPTVTATATETAQALPGTSDLPVPCLQMLKALSQIAPAANEFAQVQGEQKDLMSNSQVAITGHDWKRLQELQTAQRDLIYRNLDAAQALGTAEVNYERLKPACLANIGGTLP